MLMFLASTTFSFAQSAKPDLLAGMNSGASQAYQNTGSCAVPAFTRNATWDLPDVGSNACPGFGDFDGDGDYDLLIGKNSGSAVGYENTGTGLSPVWSAQPAWDITPGSGNFKTPAFADLDADGDLDIMFGHSDGVVYGYRNDGSNSTPSWSTHSSWNSPDVGAQSSPCLVDLDSDGDYDLLIGSSTGSTVAYLNSGSATAPTWSSQASWNPATHASGNASPAAFDKDCDGDWDLFIGSSTGTAYAYTNTGTAASPSWTYASGNNLALGSGANHLALLDLDEEGAKSATPWDYMFADAVLESGTDNQVNAVYRFADVTSGVDALITVANAVNASISQLDLTSTGFNEAFQPYINVDEGETGYVEFDITFVTSGTSTPVNMDAVRSTSIDVDGNANLHEFESYNMANAIVDYDGATELNVTNSGGWITGTNIGEQEYSGVDTMAKSVMFTVVGWNISTFTVRIGAENNTGSDQIRQRSLYFRHFQYPNSVLPVELVSFTATPANNSVLLDWTSASEFNCDYYTVERSRNSTDWEELGIVSARNLTGLGHYRLTDEQSLPGTNYYRLSQTDFDGTRVVLGLRSVVTSADEATITVYPNPSPTTVSISLSSVHHAQFEVQIQGLMGNIVYRDAFEIEGGSCRTIQLEEALTAGNYLVSWTDGLSVGSTVLVVTGTER